MRCSRSGMALIALLWLSGTLRSADAVARREPRRATGRYQPSAIDFATGVPFGVACVMALLWSIDEPFTPLTFAIALAGGALMSACIVLRNTIWAPILVSLACGAAIGLFLMLFSMFMSGPQGFLANGAIGTLIAASFVLPARQARRSSRVARMDLPIWALGGGMLILVAGVAVLIRSAA